MNEKERKEDEYIHLNRMKVIDYIKIEYSR